MNKNHFHEKVRLGQTDLMVGPLGLASSYPCPTKSQEAAFERGCNFFYWGSIRRKQMKRAIHNIAAKDRDSLVVALQSYSRLGKPLKHTFHKGLKQLKLERADVLILGWHNSTPFKRILDAANELKERGEVRYLCISGHNRPAFTDWARQGLFDLFMIRYNAAHRGAEQDVFAKLPPKDERPGIITYTATRWGQLCDPKRVPAGEKVPSGADCYRFVLSNPDVQMTYTAPRTAAELENSLQALDLGPMDEDELDWMCRVGNHLHDHKSLPQPPWRTRRD